MLPSARALTAREKPEGAKIAGAVGAFLELEPGGGTAIHGTLVGIGAIGGGAAGYYFTRGLVGIVYEVLINKYNVTDGMNDIWREAMSGG